MWFLWTNIVGGIIAAIGFIFIVIASDKKHSKGDNGGKKSGNDDVLD